MVSVRQDPSLPDANGQEQNAYVGGLIPRQERLWGRASGSWIMNVGNQASIKIMRIRNLQRGYDDRE